MSIFKKFDIRDVYVSSYEANKEYTSSGASLINDGIVFLPFGFQAFVAPSPSPTPTVTATATNTPTVKNVFILRILIIIPLHRLPLLLLLRV